MTIDDDDDNDDDEVSFVLRHFRPGGPEVATGGGLKSKSKPQRGFSDLTYVGNALRVSYRVDRVRSSTFHVSTAKPYSVTRVPRRADDDLFTEYDPSSSHHATSLFAAVSRLLRSLQQRSRAVSPVTDADESSTLRSIVENSTPSCRRIWELELGLLRCAAAGKRFLAPLPGEDWSATLLSAVTEGIDLDLLRCSGSCRDVLHRRERELLGFLLSLPRAEQSTVTTISHDKNGSRDRIRLCLDLSKSTGQEPPSFARMAALHGVTTAYHGTDLGTAWSILNHGLENRSDRCRNGAMMGSGVYLSTAYKVASHFAEINTSGQSATQAWRCQSLLRVLGCRPDMLRHDQVAVSCFPVFEARIVLPPVTTATYTHDKCTRREGTYFVVPDGHDVRITKLHLTFELVKRSTKKEGPLSSFWIVAIIVVGVLWYRSS